MRLADELGVHIRDDLLKIPGGQWVSLDKATESQGLPTFHDISNHLLDCYLVHWPYLLTPESECELQAETSALNYGIWSLVFFQYW